MKRTFLAKLLGFFSGAALFSYGVMLACGGDWDYDYRYSTNLTPEAFVSEVDRPMILSQNLFYEGGLNPVESFQESMVSDWTDYLGKSADREAVYYFLLDSSQTTVSKMYSTNARYYGKGKFDSSAPKAKEFIRFLYLAKKVEAASVSADYWSYEPIQYKSFDDEKTLDEIKNIYKSTSDKFLKHRYWFQTVKAYFYSGDKPRAISFFEQTSASVEKDKLYYRALSYVAGVHYRRQEYARANYLFSRVFDNCPELRHMALYNFHPQEQSDWNETIGMAKSADEKAAVWAMHGYYGDETEAIKNIYDLKPKSADLEFLLSRLVNKLEVNSGFSSDVPYQENQEFPKSPDAVALVSKIANAERTTKPYLWHLAAGYLQTINGDYKASKQHYDKASVQIPNDLLLQKQLRLFKIVDAVSQIQSIDTETENRLLPELKWLLWENQEGYESEFRVENAKSWMRTTMAALYQKAGNPVFAEMYHRKSGFYRNPDHLRAMKAFMEKSYWTPYEGLMRDLYQVKKEDIYHFEAVTATLDNKIQAAIDLIKKSGEQKDYELLGDPFLGNIKDCHDCDHAAAKKQTVTHLQFLEELLKKQSNIKKLEDVYTNSLLLGNAFYNMTHFGNARAFYQDEIFNFEEYRYYEPNEGSMQDVYNCTIAEKYYRQALQYAKTDEQKARCHYMLAKCERNEYYNGMVGFGGTFYYSEANVHFLAWNGFKALKNYSNTNYYREVINECGYFETYLKKP